MDGVYRRGFYNIAVHERDTTNGNERTRYEMTIKENTIHLTVECVAYEAIEREPHWNIPIKHYKRYTPAAEGCLTLYLSDEMVDFSKKVTLIVNGRRVYKGKVKADMRHMVNSCATFFDPERVYAAGIEVEL
jgi:small nuclear ribonucleoprotein (snRNP)-like protein